MKSILNIIQPYISKKIEVIVNGKRDNLFVFNWEKIEEQHFETLNKVEEMTDEEMDDFLSYNETALMQITEYFLDFDSLKKIKDKDWLPFGLLGLCHNPDSFAEMLNNGLLLFDLTKDQKNPPVILYKNSVSQTVAAHFSELELNEAE